MSKNTFKPDTPQNHAISEVFRLLKKHRLNQQTLTYGLQIPVSRVSELLNQKRRITAETDLRLCRFFSLKEGHFLKLQIDYDLSIAKIKIGYKLSSIQSAENFVCK